MLQVLESYNGWTDAERLQVFDQFTTWLNAGAAGNIVNAGPRSNYCFRATGGNGAGGAYRKVIAPGDNTYNRGFRLKPNTSFSQLAVDRDTGSGTFQNNALMLITYLSSVQCWLGIEKNGKLSLRRGAFNPVIGGGASVLIAGPTTQALSVSSWQTVRAKIVVHGSAGSIRIVVDNVEWLNATGLNTGSAAAYDEWITPVPVNDSGGVTWDIADEYLTDGVVTDGWYDIRPPMEVNPRKVTGVGGFTDGTPVGDATLDATIDEGSNTGGTGPDSDTTYNAYAATGDEGSFTHQGLANPGADMLGMALKAFIRKESSGSALAKFGLETGAVGTYPGVDRGLASTYRYVAEMMGRDPVALIAWLEANYNTYNWAVKKSL